MRVRSSIVTLAVLLTALSGCGDKDATETTADGLTKITVLRSNGATFEGLYIAQDQGYFKEAGLDVTIKAGAADTSQNVPSVLNGEAQFAMTDSAGVLKAVAQGIPVRTVIQIQASEPDAAVSDGVLVPKGSKITSAKDLAGKNVGLPALGGNVQMITQYAVEKAGGDPKSMNLVALPTASLQDAATKGQVDAISTFAAYYDGAKAAGFTAIGNGSNDFPGIPQALLFGSDEWLNGHKAAAKGFVEAMTKAFTYANAHVDDIRAVDTKYTQMDAETIKNRTIQTFNPTFRKDQVTLAAQKMYDYGIVTTQIDMDKVFWTGTPVQ
ncbi:ABC transporter substrate-binding protein [Actinoplanes sp. NPDC051851]|uniref:ABC transporter substrate-binding protein n=1 Tax=Actinoplanes sp. NPDC051851 TaxID=3154753 RepID=UPI00343DF46A